MREQRCLYANHRGVIRNTLRLFRQRLRERKQTQSITWGLFKTIFNWSPCITNLITRIFIIPVIMLRATSLLNSLLLYAKEDKCS